MISPLTSNDEKRANQTQSKQKKGNNIDQSEINEIANKNTESQ